MAGRKNSLLFQIENAVNQRKNSERLLILVALALMIGAVWKSVCFDSAVDKWNANNKKIQTIQKATEGYQRSLDDLIRGHQVDRLKPLRIKKNDLLKDIQDLDAEIQKTLDGSVSAEEMRSLLMSVLRGIPGLKVVSLKNTDDIELSSENVEKSKSEKEEATDHADQTLVKDPVKATAFLFYKHGMRIEFEGDYESTLQYLKQLEGLKYKLIWEDIKYTVKSYPTAQIELTVMTINDKKGWVGV